MSAFSGLVGQAAAVALLERMIATRRVPHALLFHGPQGVGKATAARILAAALLCREAAAAGDPCGVCGDCRLVAHDGHPDVLTVRLPPKKDTAASDELASMIRIDQIREVSRLAGLAPRMGSRRVFVVDPADRMNSESQNALLKTLEEPPGAVLIVLVAERPHVLLATVRSRSFSLPFSALRTADLAAWLERSGMPADEARVRAALAAGRPGAALGLDATDLREHRDAVFSMLESLAADPRALSDLATHAAALAGKDEPDLLAALDWIEVLLRDAARASLGNAAPLVHADLATRLAGLGRRLGPERAAALVRAVERLRGYLRFNTNRLLIAETVLAAVAGGPLP